MAEVPKRGWGAGEGLDQMNLNGSNAALLVIMSMNLQ